MPQRSARRARRDREVSRSARAEELAGRSRSVGSSRVSTVVERWCSGAEEKLATAAERMVEDTLLSEAERIGPKSQGCLAQMVGAEEAKKRWT